MKTLPKWLASLIGDANFDQTVTRVVSILSPAAWKSMQRHGQGMTSFEASGYIRARSALLISRQVAVEIENGLAAKYRGRLTEAVREQLIQTLLPQMMRLAPASTMRRAA